jgi:PAS domain S-box-containing protein
MEELENSKSSSQFLSSLPVHSGSKDHELPIRISENICIFFECITDCALILLDLSGRVETWNAGANHIFGYSAGEAIGRDFSFIQSSEDVANGAANRNLEVAAQVGQSRVEGWRVRRDGSRFLASVVVSALRNSNGGLRGFGVFIRDSTEKKAEEEAFRQSEERVRLIVDSVQDYAIFMLDSEGHIVSWNEGARRIKGYESKEILGKHFSVFYDAEDVAAGKCAYELKEAAAKGRFEDENWRLRKDGTKFWANVVITALRSPEGELLGFAKITKDMTDRKRQEDQLRMAQDGLEREVAIRTSDLRKAIAARDEFLSIASHELRTPLTSLQLQQQILERQIAKTVGESFSLVAVKEVAYMAGKQIAQLSHLVSEMLDASRISTGKWKLELKECNLSELVKNVFAGFIDEFKTKGILANLVVEENLTLTCDPSRIKQVISNLLRNAEKYGQKAPIEVKVRRLGDSVDIDIKDYGPGIDPKDQIRIFERYERAIPASETSGLGLGLFISKKIIEAHGGNIRVQSAPRNGAEFVVSIPIDS